VNNCPAPWKMVEEQKKTGGGLQSGLRLQQAKADAELPIKYFEQMHLQKLDELCLLVSLVSIWC